MKTFRLYPTEKRWWSFQDYEGLLSIVERFKPKRVLEFGPGSSTFALIEGGAEHVTSCEDDRHWLDIYSGQFVKHPVTLAHYTWADPLLDIPLLEGRFDLAFIDGPRDTPKRPAVIRYCLERTDVVVCPAEGPFPTAYLVSHVEALAAEYGRKLEWVMTGPLTYAMGVMTC